MNLSEKIEFESYAIRELLTGFWIGHEQIHVTSIKEALSFKTYEDACMQVRSLTNDGYYQVCKLTVKQ